MVSSFFTNLAVVAGVLGVMIFIHEMGHFLAAKAFKVRVLTFSLGFGKRLWGFKHGDTDYRVSAVPLGGYVKMAGENPGDKVSGSADEFQSKPRWLRFIVILMGPLMNGVLAVVLLTATYHFHFAKPAYKDLVVRVGDVEPGSRAEAAGIRVGDKILKIGEMENPVWEDFALKIATSVDEEIPFVLEREGGQIHLSVTPEAKGRDRLGYVGLYPWVPAVLGGVRDDFPAQEAGLLPGDEIVQAGELKFPSASHISPLLQEMEGAPLELTILRQGKEHTVSIKPIYGEIQGEKKWLIGVNLRPKAVVVQLPWGEAWTQAFAKTRKSFFMTFEIIGKMFTGGLSPRALSGPIGIAQITGQAFGDGFLPLLEITAFISLQLGIFNLLPIPVLDGGVLLLLLVESLMRRDMSLQFKERFSMAGFFFLILIASFVIVNDILKLVGPS